MGGFSRVSGCVKCVMDRHPMGEDAALRLRALLRIEPGPEGHAQRFTKLESGDSGSRSPVRLDSPSHKPRGG
jgi:hypothetical protein